MVNTPLPALDWPSALALLFQPHRGGKHASQNHPDGAGRGHADQSGAAPAITAANTPSVMLVPAAADQIGFVDSRINVPQ